MTGFDRKFLCALLLCTAATPFTARAADESTPTYSGFQFGVGLGQGNLHLSVPDTPGSSDLNSVAYTVFAGYRINRYAAAEASYLDSGSVSLANAAGSFNTHPHIVTATGLGVLPLNDAVSLFARAGLAHWWYDANFYFPALGRVSFSEKPNELIWGGGASVFVEGALLRLEYAQTKTSPSFEGQTLDARLRVISLSVVWML